MKIVITGSLGNISRRLTEQLAAKGHDVTVVTHNPERVKDIQSLNAKAATGTIENRQFLADTFTGADAAYIMIPPNLNTTDLGAFMKDTGERYATAIEAAGIKHVVNLSGIGAHLADGYGPSSAFHHVEERLNQLPATHILHLRPGMFYTNFYGNIDMIRHMNIIGNNFDAATSLAMSHPHDIADVAADALDTLSFTGKQVRYVVSDEKSGGEIARVLGNAIGKPGLPWIQFPDEELLHGMRQNGLSQHMASNFVAMGAAIRTGILWEDYNLVKPGRSGKISFEDFAREFAAVYNM